MGDFVTYIIPAVVVLVLVAATVWVIYVNVAKPKPKPSLPVEQKQVQRTSIVVPSAQQLQEVVEAWQKGGKEGLVHLMEQRQQQRQQQSEREAQKKP